METIYIDKDQNLSINRVVFVAALFVFAICVFIIKSTTVNALIFFGAVCYFLYVTTNLKKHFLKNYIRVSGQTLHIKLNNSKVYTIEKSHISNVRLIYNHSLVITTIDSNRFVFNVKNIEKENLEVLLKINSYNN